MPNPTRISLSKKGYFLPSPSIHFATYIHTENVTFSKLIAWESVKIDFCSQQPPRILVFNNKVCSDVVEISWRGGVKQACGSEKVIDLDQSITYSTGCR